MKLNAREERFAQLVANGTSYSDAYRQIKKNASDLKENTIWSNASALASKVSPRIDEIKQELAEQGIWTRAQSVEILAEIASHGDKNSDRVAAVKEINAMHGFNEPVKHDITNSDGSLRPVEVVFVRPD
jgi:hypothetical protein